MTNIKIKDEFKDEVVGFNNSGIPLGQRSQEDLRGLARLAHESNPGLKKYFEELPEPEDLKEEQTNHFLAQHSTIDQE